jgi:hypothetical protein
MSKPKNSKTEKTTPAEAVEETKTENDLATETPALKSSAPNPLPEQTTEEPGLQLPETSLTPIEGTTGLVEAPKEETFYDRLTKERDELKEKYVKLHAFLLNKSKAIEIVGKEQHALLVSQLHHMDAYLSILDRRIALL